ncbi:MAG: type IV pilus twitching motility protein PilT [Gammaproteobacteria bacterium]|nr:MAG: type IV pilus twitching motility protein PilT [Gammaproteobacteria bacterium]
MSQADTSTSRTAAGNAIDEYLKRVAGQRGSDLHFIAGQPPRMRLYGELQALENEPLAQARAEEMLLPIMSAAARADFEKRDSTDFAYAVSGIARFRVNVFRHLGGMGAVFRSIPSQAKTLKELDLPSVLTSLARQPQGMILVTGKTGSGKSTTLAAIIDEINNRIPGHIITIEDPIEFVHARKKCLISQREVGHHTPSFAAALTSALREDPDVILVGEMRDLETISIAVTAAEMGILVMGTLHTNGAAQTVDRIVNSFPTDKQSHVRTMLSTSLRGVISQQLVPRKGEPGLVAALEIMVNTPAVANLIRQGKLDQLENAMQGGRQAGMKTMDSSLRELFDKGIASGRAAYDAALDKKKFEEIKDLN